MALQTIGSHGTLQLGLMLSGLMPSLSTQLSLVLRACSFTHPYWVLYREEFPLRILDLVLSTLVASYDFFPWSQVERLAGHSHLQHLGWQDNLAGSQVQIRTPGLWPEKLRFCVPLRSGSRPVPVCLGWISAAPVSPPEAAGHRDIGSPAAL